MLYDVHCMPQSYCGTPPAAADSKSTVCFSKMMGDFAGLPLWASGWGFPLATKSMTPSYFHRKQ